MDRGKVRILIIVLVVGYAAFFAANFFYLKSTIKWPDAEMADSTDTTLFMSDGINLTWDVSGESGPKNIADFVKEQEEIAQLQRDETLDMVDSIVVKEAAPIETDIANTQQDLAATKDQVNELERLLAMITTQADSVDQANAKKLSKIIEQMKPVDAAGIMIGLSDRTNAELLLKMKQRQAARILSNLPQDRAAEVAKYLSKAYGRSSI
jgi:flagellar motility protein MotE (MotC chaperone)